ncbi:hypothetical protein [uncultured Mailhella sp.]|uniref:hypothetical protein n=1 Tax=uncultured Mailhella sp. TaxID=1981031 RepID=UPI0026214DE5|nr:hypothetical protein [uncultured Mailhella sp.]
MAKRTVFFGSGGRRADDCALAYCGGICFWNVERGGKVNPRYFADDGKALHEGTPGNAFQVLREKGANRVHAAKAFSCVGRKKLCRTRENTLCERILKIRNGEKKKKAPDGPGL